MASWADFEREAPPIAAKGRELLYARGDGEALLGTVAGDEPPRIHPINVGVVEGELYAFLGPSAKQRDLESDGRFALHTHQDPGAPDELALRGHATRVDDTATRARIAKDWFFPPPDTYPLYAFSIESAILGLRGPTEWPPRYSRWSARRDGAKR
jgi:hypothetical protein